MILLCIDATDNGEAHRKLAERVVKPYDWRAYRCEQGGGTRGRDRYWFTCDREDGTIT